ncbi:MAG: acyl-CoA thioesterase [Calditrichia bacterium]
MQREIFESRLKVRTYELDSYGHVNNAVYLNYLELARMEVLEAKGLTLDGLKRDGYLLLISRVEIEYKYPAFAGDLLVIRTHLADHRATSGTFAQEIIRQTDQKTIAKARVTWVVTNLQGRPVRMPPAICQAFHIDLKGH